MNAPNTPYRPLLSDAARPSTFNVIAIDESGTPRDTPIAGEHPLTLYVDKQELLTLMTLGGAPEGTAVGVARPMVGAALGRGGRRPERTAATASANGPPDRVFLRAWWRICARVGHATLSNSSKSWANAR
jgi:hypothetical protein